MAKESKPTNNWGKFETMLLLKLSSESLEHYFSLKKEGKSDNEIKGEFEVSINKAPLDLVQLLGDFTYSFFGDKSLKKWSLREEIKNMPDQQKYAFKKIGQHVKGNKVDMLEEERGFDYIRSYLRYLKDLKSDDEKIRNIAYEKLSKFFKGLAEITAKEADNMEF